MLFSCCCEKFQARSHLSTKYLLRVAILVVNTKLTTMHSSSVIRKLSVSIRIRTCKKSALNIRNMHRKCFASPCKNKTLEQQRKRGKDREEERTLYWMQNIIVINRIHNAFKITVVCKILITLCSTQLSSSLCLQCIKCRTFFCCRVMPFTVFF